MSINADIFAETVMSLSDNSLLLQLPWILDSCFQTECHVENVFNYLRVETNDLPAKNFDL